MKTVNWRKNRQKVCKSRPYYTVMYSSLILYLYSHFFRLFYEDKDATEIQIFFKCISFLKFSLWKGFHGRRGACNIFKEK